jgi:hypothetical protein
MVTNNTINKKLLKCLVYVYYFFNNLKNTKAKHLNRKKEVLTKYQVQLGTSTTDKA